MQTTLLSLAIAAILALLTALLGPHFVDWNQYRPAFEAEASRLVGLPVRVAGAIDARLLPSPTLILGGVEIGQRSEQPADDALLRARALGIEFALGSLLRGQLRAVDMRVIAPQLTVNIDHDGRAALPEAAGFNLGALAIEHLRVEDARLVVSDAASATRSVFDKIWFQGEMRSLAGPFRGEGAFVWAGGLYGYRVTAARPDDSGSRIKFSIDPSDRPLAIEGEGIFAIESGIPRFDGSVALTRAAGATLAGGRPIMTEPWRVGARVKAVPSSALLEQIEFQYGTDDRALKLNGTAELKLGASPRLEGVVSGRQIDLDRLAGLPDGARRDPAAVLQVLSENFVSVLRPPLPIQLGIGIDTVTLGGAAIQNLRGDLASDGTALVLSGLEFRAPGFTQVQASGRLDLQSAAFAGPVDMASVDPRILLGWLEGRTDVPTGPAKPIRARGDLALASGAISVERLRAELDRKAVEGRFAYTAARDGRKARLDAALKASELDLDGMLDFAATLSGPSVQRPGEIALSFDVERGQFAGIEMKQTSARLTYDATGLSIEHLNIRDFGGVAVDAKGKIDTTASSPRGSVTLGLNGRDLSGMTALAEKLAPRSAPFMRALSEKTGAARLQAMFDVDADERPGYTKAKLNLGGSFGALRVNLNAEAVGTPAQFAQSELRLIGTLEADDANALLLVTGLNRVLAAPKGAGRFAVSANGPLNGELRFTGQLQAAELDIRAQGKGRVPGDKDVSADFQLSVAGANAAPLRPRSAAAAAEKLPVTLTARAGIAGTAVTLDDITASIAATPLRGRLILALASTPGIDGQIEAGAIDGAALLAALAGMPPQGDPATLSEQPFGQGLLPDIQGRIALRIGRADLSQGFVANNLRASLRLAPAQVAFENVEADALGGRFTGELSLRKSAEGLTSRGRIALKGADAAQLIAAEGASPVVGRVALNAEFEGTGLSPRALVGSLQGAGTVSLESARISGLNVKAFAAAMQAADAGTNLEPTRIRDVVVPVLDAGALVVPSADGTLTLSAGQARLGTLIARAEGADLSISGNYDLSARSLDARLLLSGQAAITSAGRPEIAVSLRGPAAAPKRAVDVSGLTGWLALRSVEQQSKKLEAIERGAALPLAPETPAASPSPSTGSVTDDAARPRAAPRPASDTKAPPRERAAPLPPPIDIRPSAGERRPRAENELTRPRFDERPQSPRPQLFGPLPRE